MYSQVDDRTTTADIVDGDLELTTGDRTVVIAAVWLRDHCVDAASRDPISGQRLFGITDLDPDVRLATAEVNGDVLEVVFAPDGHRSTYSIGYLLGGDEDAVDRRTEAGKRLWPTAADATPVRRVPLLAYLADRAPVLRAVVDDGYALLSRVPTHEGAVTEIAETFGFVRETNYGRIFDVRIEEHATNLAFTGRAITPHTDNPYRDPVPTLQLLHCLINGAEGGDSALVDGFAAAARLRAEDPAAFEILTTTNVVFRFDAADAHLTAAAPLIELDAERRIRQIRFNNRSIQVPAMPRDRAHGFYAAYRAFAELLFAPEAQLAFRMGPGDCLVFDNTRLLHARTAFAAVGGRHLQGTYADLDGLLSTLAVAEADR